MDRKEFMKTINGSLKLVRTEYGMTQDKMALALGISKKSLVESEKGRRELGWTECAALATVFGQSHILQNAFGTDPADIVQAIAFDDLEVKYPPTMGGIFWWNDVKVQDGYRIQQNMISQHYRLLNDKNQRLIASFELADVEEYLSRLLESRR